MEKLNVKLENCNNIEEWNIILNKNCLNIKYAINWTWKSTLAKSIKYTINEKNKLEQLIPFSKRWTKIVPKISWIDDFNKVMIFDEDYIHQYTFQNNEILKGSFDIFIKSDKYDEWITKINKLTEAVRNTFQEDETINDFILDLENFLKFYWKSDKPAKSGALMKWISEWNKFEHIPTWLEKYTDFIKSKNIKWLSWQLEGKNFLEIKENNCPYCISWIKEKKGTILKVSDEYESKKFEHLTKVLEVIEGLYNYFPENIQNIINQIFKNIDWLNEEDLDYLKNIKEESELMLKRLNKIKNINFHHFNNIDKIEEELQNMKINLSRYNFFISDFSKEKITLINNNLDTLLENIWNLIWAIQQQKWLIKRTIDKYKIEMNYFLKSAWYKYEIDSIEEWETYKLILKHEDWGEHLNWKNHLSFWERNALALVLFMYQCLSEKADFIVFDDPISSFDKNKKFAILNMFFNWFKVEWEAKWENLRWKTILMLTHDFDPVIDIIHNNLKNLDLAWKSAYFLENNNWKLIEKEIISDDIKSFWEILKGNIQTDNLVNIVYLRRYYEINNNKNWEYNLISSLVHKRSKPTKYVKKYISVDEYEIEEQNMTQKEINKAVLNIQTEFLSNFDYNEILKVFLDNDKMLKLYKSNDSNYEKLQLYRIIKDWEWHENAVVMKFINETFHIENDYLFQLNPRKYEIIPHYIIEECNKDLWV